MTDIQDGSASGKQQRIGRGSRRAVSRKRHVLLSWAGLALIALLTSGTWLGLKASLIRNELSAATGLFSQLQQEVLTNDGPAAARTVAKLQEHTAAARTAATDPLWTMAAALPWAGANFEAATVIATSADDVAKLTAGPLVNVMQSLSWQDLFTKGEGLDVERLQAAEPVLAAAAHALSESYNRLDTLDADSTVPQITTPLNNARTELASLRDDLNSAASIASVIPNMTGVNEPRNYLLMVQNNAELRASGGIPGALAVLKLENGRLSLGSQRSAGSLQTFMPPLEVDSEQTSIYSRRLGKFMQDVNLTPDFPTAAELAVKMWQQEFGEKLNGALSVDPVALSYLMNSTGPIKVGLSQVGANPLPDELTAENVVPTLLSDVYKQVEDPRLQDAYFAAVAQEVFTVLAAGDIDRTKLISGLNRGAKEGRLLVWSADATEQNTIARYSLSGSISGPSVAPAQFGVYFNDGTGAKMDYYVKRTVQLVKECPKDGYEQTTVRVTSMNTAPADAALSLPAYVTGGGNYGVPPGSVQTNIVAYGPAQAHVETANLNGQKTEFAPYFHGNRPVGVLAIRLAPGESKTVDFTFGKIVQHTEPNVVVTPTVQDVKDVTLPTETVACG